MSRWLQRVILAAVLIGFTPMPAAAQLAEIIRWLNDMSGQQMWGVAYEAYAVCLYGRGDQRQSRIFPQCPQYLDEKLRREWGLGARVGYLSNFKRFFNERDARDINMFFIGPTVRWSPPDSKAVDISASFELGRWYGESVPESFWVKSIQAGAVVRPITLFRPTSRSAEFLGVSLNYQKFFDTFEGRDFAAQGLFFSDKEVITKVVVHIDVFTFITAIRTR